MNLWKWLLGKTTPSEEERSAIAAFLVLHPGEHIMWTRTIAEEHRSVVGVFYGRVRPPRYQFFEVEKTTQQAHPLEDDTVYRPKVWR